MSATEPEISPLLRACSTGDARAADLLFSLLYKELRTVAHRQLRGEAEGHTLNTTALVHEVYLTMADPVRSGWQDRAHFLAVASRAMRHILIDYARARLTAKRGGASIRVPLRENVAAPRGGDSVEVDLLALEAALVDLSNYDDRLARVVECRFFGGMSVEETAEALAVAVRTVERDWTRAKAYLFQHLAE